MKLEVFWIRGVMMSILDFIQKKMKDSLSKHALGEPQALHWGHKKSQEIRFEQFLKLYDFTNKSILDVGCGFGDFYDYLIKNGIKPQLYCGLDIQEDIISYNLKKFKDNQKTQFVCEDLLKFKKDLYDVVIASGTFNFYTEGWPEFVKSCLIKMKTLSHSCFIFNLEDKDQIPKENQKSYLLSKKEWETFFYSLDENVVILDGYHKSDFTVKVGI